MKLKEFTEKLNKLVEEGEGDAEVVRWEEKGDRGLIQTFSLIFSNYRINI